MTGSRIVVTDDGRRDAAVEGRDIGEHLLGAAGAVGERRHGQLILRLEVVLRSLRDDAVLRSARRDRSRTTACVCTLPDERDQHVGGHVVLGEPEELRLGAIDVDVQASDSRRPAGCAGPRLPGSCAAAAADRWRRRRLAATFMPDDLYVEWARQAEVQGLAHDVSGQEGEGGRRKTLRASERRSRRT